MHLSDEQIALVALQADAAAPDGHLSACRACASRLEALEQALAGDRADAAARADHAMAGRLERQRLAILKRIGGARVSARILRFPVHGAAPAMPRRKATQRAVAAAASVGLLVGTLAGGLFSPHFSILRPERTARARTPVEAPQSVPALQASAVAEERFLREFEAALGGPPVEPLRTLDELTPR
jgi:hypothetical protein